MSNVVVLHQFSLVAGLFTSSVIVSGVILYCYQRVRFFRHQSEELSNRYNRQVLQAALESQENERRRFAADLHDEVGATLAAVRLGLELLARERPEIRGRVQESLNLIDGTMDSIRRISHGLMPATLERHGLRQALLELCQQLTLSTEWTVEFEEQGKWLDLSPQRETLIYRIVQELVQNALKHAGKGPIVIHVVWGEALTVEVSDHGSGFDARLRSHTHGIGMLNVENRARLLGGRVKYAQRQPTGTRVQLSIPVQ